MIWRETTLGALVAESGGFIRTGPFGSQLHASDYVQVGVPSVMPVNIGDNIINPTGIAMVSDEDADRLGRHRMTAGDIVFSRRGDVERRALVRAENEGWLCGTGCLRVHFGAQLELNPAFIAYALGTATAREWLTQHAVGATMPNLNTKILSNVPMALPDISEQQAIAEVLGALDDKIAANAKLNSAINSTIAAGFRESMASGFEERAMLDVIDFTFGEAFKGAHFSEPGIGRPLIRIRDLRSQKLQVWTTEVRPRETVIRAGDIVIGMDAEFRATTWLGIDGLLNQRVCRAKSELMSNALLREVLREPLAAIEKQKSATTVIHLNKSDIARTNIRVPLSDSRERFRARYDAAYELSITSATESERLAALRDALLPELMSGRLRVKDAERTVEEVI